MHQMPTFMASSPVIFFGGVSVMIDAAEIGEKWQEIEEVVHRYRSMAVAGQFAAVVMHEINGPLEAVTNLNFLIQQDTDNPALVRQYSQLIEEQLLSLAKLSRQTLSFYRSAETREMVAISTLAEAALRVHQKNIYAKQILIRRTLPSDITAQVNAGDMLQVFSNLVANAVDAMPEKGTLQVRVKRCSREVHITVADNGHGIPDPIRTRIFEPFFTTKRERGNGLGLAISKAIVEKHQGRIRTRSSTRTPRSGTIFRITLPFGEQASSQR
jgi:signal transduction histidine kinase